MVQIIRSIININTVNWGGGGDDKKQKPSPTRALRGQKGAIPQSIIADFSAQTQAAQHQTAATLITQHHLYKKVTDLPTIISQPTMPYNWALAAEAAGQRSPNGSDALMLSLNLLASLVALP